MDKHLQKLCDSLDDLSVAVVNGWSDDRTMNLAWGWNYPNLNRHDLARIPEDISARIKKVNLVTLDKNLIQLIDEIPIKIEEFKSRTLAYLYNGHGQHAVPVFLSLMHLINSTISPIFSWEVLQKNKALPINLSRRLTSIQSQLEELIPEKEALEKQISLIKEATETAENLPTSLLSLKKAKRTIDSITTKAAEKKGLIDKHYKTIEETVEKISLKKSETDKLVDQCEDAYRITTTKGLAAAFTERANKSQTSMYIWVIGLLIALGSGIYIGSLRYSSLLNAINAEELNWGVIWMNSILTLFSLSAPIWFAWISTKQISQRFRLAEDYSFKASVAKAYEGYRKEASRIDKAFEARLFSSALTRLEEAPLRLLEKDTPGSPWHELISSPQFEKALDKIPELKDKFISITNTIINESKKEKTNKNTGNKDN